MSVPVILDCDPGHDDVFAIWLAAGNPQLDLRAVTTVGGNGQLTHTTHNALVVCSVAGITDVPVAAGSDTPLVQPLQTADDIHGANALGGPQLPEPSVSLDGRTALELMRDTLDASADPVTVVATGPLTNIALFVRAFPDRVSKIERVVWMGGSTGRGNMTPYAEFNAWTDPEAISVVLASGLPLSMVGLNVTHQVLATGAVLERIAAIGNAASRFGVELLHFFNSAYEVAEGMPAAPLHDPVAVALVAAPDAVTAVHTRLDVELAGTHTRGATSVDLLGTSGLPANAHVATDVDVPRFWQLVEDAIRALD